MPFGLKILVRTLAARVRACNSVNLKPGGIIEPSLKIVGDEYEAFQRVQPVELDYHKSVFISL